MESILSLLSAFLSPTDLAYLASVVAACVAVLVAVAKVVGTASIAVALLRSGVPRLQALADRTESRLDNRLVSALGSALSVVAAVLEACRKVLDKVALNGKAK